MLTIVSVLMQPGLTHGPLTSVDMSTLSERLTLAMGSTVKQADLARACGVSRAAVTKWLSGSLKDLKMAHLFAAARCCGVEAEWLALDQGPMRHEQSVRATSAAPSPFEQRHLSLLRLYLTLPDEQRFAVRMLIETLSGAQNPRLHRFMQQIEAFNHERDGTTPAPPEKRPAKRRG